MKTDNGLAIAFFAVVIGGAVALAITNDIAAPACAEAKRALSSKEFDFGCLEFWFNRYQSLIGNLITAAVAGVTLIWVKAQLVPASEQSNLAKAKALKEDVLPELLEQRERIQKALALLTKANDPDFPMDRSSTEVRNWTKRRLDRQFAAVVKSYHFVAASAEESNAPQLRIARDEISKILSSLGALDYELAFALSPETAENWMQDEAGMRRGLHEIWRQSRGLVAKARKICRECERKIVRETQATGRALRSRREDALGPYWRA